MIGCQVETTMPFHDYWWVPPKLASIPKAVLLGVPLAGLLLPLLAAILGWIGWMWAIALAVVLLIAGVLFDYWLIMHKGPSRFRPPRAPRCATCSRASISSRPSAASRASSSIAIPAEWGAAFRAFSKAIARPTSTGPPSRPG
jgi:hypothetical protein